MSGMSIRTTNQSIKARERLLSQYVNAKAFSQPTKHILETKSSSITLYVQLVEDCFMDKEFVTHRERL